MQPLNKTKLVYFSLNKRNKKSRLDFTEKHRKESAQLWGTKILGADETKNYMTASLQGVVLWLPVEPGQHCLLMMWSLLETAGWTLKCVGLYALLRFRQLLQNWSDSKAISIQESSFSGIKCKAECRESHIQATDGSCGKGLAKDLKRRSTASSGVHGF